MTVSSSALHFQTIDRFDVYKNTLNMVQNMISNVYETLEVSTSSCRHSIQQFMPRKNISYSSNSLDNFFLKDIAHTSDVKVNVTTSVITILARRTITGNSCLCPKYLS